jgi:steroid delta-isomerase
MVLTKDVTRVVTAYFADMAAMDPEGWVQHFTEDALIYDPVGNPPSHAHIHYRSFFRLMRTVFAQVEISQDHIFVVQEHAAVKWTLRAHSKNGKQSVAEGISVFEIHPSGKIQKVMSYWNDKLFQTQLE